MEEKISVIIPVYNVKPYLARCLDSIISNTYRNLEIICIDDGSTDGCGAILDIYAQQDLRIMVIHQENRGVSAARNSGMNVATGVFISFIDADDWIHPQYFEILMYIQKKKNYDLVCCEYQKISEKQPFTNLERVDINEICLDLVGIYQRFAPKTLVWGKLFRRRIVEGKRFIEKMNCSEDVAYNALVMKDCPDINACIVTTPLYFYYNRPGSLVHQLPKGLDLEVAKIFYKYAEEAKNDNVKYVFWLESLKRYLAARYELVGSFDRNDKVVECDKQIRGCARNLCLLKGVPLREKSKYIILACCPKVFDFYYIIKRKHRRR